MRRSPYAASQYQDCDPPSDTDCRRSFEPDPYTNGHCHTPAFPNTLHDKSPDDHLHTHGDGDSYKDSGADAHALLLTHGDHDADTNLDGHLHADTHVNADVHPHLHCHFHPDPDSNPDWHADSDADAHVHPHAVEDTAEHFHAHVHRNRDSDCDCNRDCHTNANTNTDGRPLHWNVRTRLCGGLAIRSLVGLRRRRGRNVSRPESAGGWCPSGRSPGRHRWVLSATYACAHTHNGAGGNGDRYTKRAPYGDPICAADGDESANEFTEP